MAQYAIKGYEVDAMDFVLKPVNYYAFSMKLHKARRILWTTMATAGSPAARSRRPLPWPPFSGRNYEHYSEDPVISGKTAAVISGRETRAPSAP